MAPALSRLRGGDRLVAGGAAALLLFMFAFDWFGGSFHGTLPGSDLSGAGTSLTGWETFTNSRWVWLLTAIVALASVLMRGDVRRLVGSLQPGFAVALLGALSSLLILYRIVHHPTAGGGFGGFHASYGIRIGIWLGLIASLAIAAGGYLQLNSEADDAPTRRELADAAFSGLTAPRGQGSGARPSPPSSVQRASPERSSPTDPPAGAP
jgi:hypothetical protein